MLDSLFINFGDDGYLLGDVTIDGDALHKVGVRFKGFSSTDTGFIKNPFNIDLEYSFNNQNHQGYKKLKLANVIQDPSFIREVLSYEIARKYMPASLANFANVYVNDTLIGLYSNVEAVDKNFVDNHFGSKDNSFFKGAPDPLVFPYGNNANLYYQGPDTNTYKNFYTLESDNSESSWTDLLRLINILNNDTANLDTILNIDRALWMHAFNYTLVNLDSYIGYSQNYYLYMDNNGRFNPILWDLNMSFGSFKETDGISPMSLTIQKRKTLNPLKMLTSAPLSPRPLIVNLLQNNTYKRMFLAHMRTIINENFKNNLYLTRGQELQNMIDSSVQNDSNKFYSYSSFHQNLDTTVSFSGNISFPGLKDFMEARMSYLDTFPGFPGAPVISNIIQPDYPEQGSEIWITARVTGASEVFLGCRFKNDGIFKRINMYDDGNHHDSISGDGIFGAAIIVTGTAVQYYIYAQNDSAGIFSPERAEYEYYSIQPKLKKGDIVFNEIMTQNSSTCTDQDGEYDGWIELYNTTCENQNLKNLFLSDDPTVLTKWTIPDTTITAKGYLIIWGDNNISQTGLHTNFTLPENNGQLILSNGSSPSIDSVSYGLQLAEKTYGRYPNGYGDFVYMLPTFARNNFIGTTPLSDFLLFPNPASTSIYIEMLNPENFVTYQIFNSKGQKVISGNFNFESSPFSSGLYSIDITKLAKGIYFIKAETANNSVIKKIIVGK